MTEIKIPSITIDTPIPFDLNLRGENQPLRGLHLGKHTWSSRLTEVRIWENHARWHGGVGEVINYTVRTTGFAPQTKREKTFHVTERAAMVKFVNEWIVKTVAAGLKEMAQQKAEKVRRDDDKRAWMAHLIEKAGGIEERRQQIVREGYYIAAREVLQFEGNDVYGAIMVSLTHHTPITIDEETRAKIVEKYERLVKESWSVKSHIAARMQELDEYLGKTQQEDAA